MKRKNNRGLIISLIAILLILVGGSFVYFNNVTGHSKKENEKIIKVGATGTSFPTAYKENGKLTGFDIEFFNDAAKRAGYKVKWVTGEFDGLLGQLDNGQLDTVANDIAITPEREQKYRFSDVYNKEETTVAVNKNSKINSLHDLEGKTISGAAASNNTQNLKNYDKKIKFKMFDARDLTYEALLSGHVDGVVNTRNNLEALIKKNHYNWKVINGSAATVKIALPFKKDNTGKLNKLNQAIESMKKDGTLVKLSKKYFGYDATK